MAKLIQILRFAHVQRMQQNRIQHTEHGEISSDPKHQSECHHNRKCGRLPQHPKCITNIQKQVLEVWQTLSGTNGFPYRLSGPYLQSSVAAVFFESHLSAHAPLRLNRLAQFEEEHARLNDSRRRQPLRSTE